MDQPVTTNNVTLSTHSTRNDKTRSIDDLPADVLIAIFKIVHSMSLRYPSAIDGANNEIFWQDEDLSSLTWFPEALAAVCPSWKDILSLVSVFWTRLIIFVDDHPTPSPAISDHLALSADNHLEIVITRRPGAFPSADPCEKSRVSAVMDVLTPNISRWKRLFVDVLHHHSIPRPHIDIYGEARHLRHICLQSRLQDALHITYYYPKVEQDESNDGYHTYIVEQAFRRTSQLQHYDTATRRQVSLDLHAPQLAKLHVDGLTFCTTYLSTPRTIARVRELTISHYGSTYRNQFKVDQLIRCLQALPYLQHLMLVDVEIGPSNGNMFPAGDCTMARCTLEDLSSRTLLELRPLLISPSITKLDFRRCAAPPWRGGPRMVFFLNVEEIDSSDHLIWLLQSYRPLCLGIKSCPGFNTDFLLALGTRTNTGEWMCEFPVILELSDCGNFSSDELRQMVERRDSANVNGRRGLTRLKVSGCGELNPEDKASLAVHIGMVTWDTETFGIACCDDSDPESDENAESVDSFPGRDAPDGEDDPDATDSHASGDIADDSD